MSAAVEVDSITVTYGDSVVLRDVSFVVPEGSITAVVGESGCGKTTLLRTIAGLEPIRSGRITVGGVPVAGDGLEMPPERRRIGLVPQEGALFGHLSVAGNVGFGLGPWWRRRADRAARVDELLDVVGLAEMRSRRPGTLSGGQRQRVALARALAPRPAVIALDEPFSALDAQLRARLRGHVRQAILADNATGLLVTHDRDEAMDIADVIVVLIDGRVRQIGTPRQIYTEAADLAVARLFGEVMVVDAVARGVFADSEIGSLRLRGETSGLGTVLVRPGDLEMCDIADAPTATVRRVHLRGDDLTVTAERNGVELSVRADLDADLAAGDVVRFRQRRPVHFVPGTTTRPA